MRPNDPAGGDEAGGYARAIRAEPIGYRIDIDAVEIMEQEQRARQRGQPPDRGDPATIIQPAHVITCSAAAARQTSHARRPEVRRVGRGVGSWWRRRRASANETNNKEYRETQH